MLLIPEQADTDLAVVGVRGEVREERAATPSLSRTLPKHLVGDPLLRRRQARIERLQRR
jgi:hypothetical protein